VRAKTESATVPHFDTQLRLMHFLPAKNKQTNKQQQYQRQQLFCSTDPPPLPCLIFPEGRGGSSVHRLLYCSLCTYQYGSPPSTPQPRILIACPPRAPPLVWRYTPTMTRKENQRKWKEINIYNKQYYNYYLKLKARLIGQLRVDNSQIYLLNISTRQN